MSELSTFLDGRVILHAGDCRDVLKTFADNSIDSICCDPPYELKFMGRAWDNTGIAYDIKLWAEVLRVLKPGGYIMAFSGCRTYHRMACAIEDAGRLLEEFASIYLLAPEPQPKPVFAKGSAPS
jgi:DNA modification methylase